MPAALLPRDEPIRLAALRVLGILDVPGDAQLHDLVRLAALVAGAPIGLVSLVDRHRQWFKAAHGLPPGLHETPRSQAFCAHAILESPASLCVTDATQGPRFSDNPLVTGPFHLRAYAGALLHTGEGQPIGTLCVLDMRVRPFTTAQLLALRDLADIVNELIAPGLPQPTW
jgi:GAF domain-containing protein